MPRQQFKPAWWLPNSHLQTLWPAIFRHQVKDLELSRERFELPDHDFVDVDWVGNPQDPIVLILHGFEGSLQSHYAKGMLKTILASGWRGAFMYFRGCSGEHNRLPRGYHSGETADVAFIVEQIKKREPNVPIAAIGYSLGGNILLKWLGETGKDNPLQAAVAVSVPFDLHKAAQRIQHGFSRFYQWYLLRCARGRLLQKFLQVTAPIDLNQFAGAQTIRDFDNHYTVPLHGFSTVDEYYTQTSSGRFLQTIQVPTLIIHAKDDPFMTEDIIPDPTKISPHVTLEVTENGGHVGFISGTYPWSPHYWLEERTPEFLKNYLKKPAK